MKRHFILGIFLSILVGPLMAYHDCDDPQLQTDYLFLKSKIDAFDTQNADQLSDSLLTLIQEYKLGHCYLVHRIKLIKGEAIELKFEWERALEYYYDLIKEADKLGYKDIIAESYICLGRVHERLNRPIDCKRNLLTAYKIIKALNIEAMYSHFARRYSSYHRIFESRDSAIYYANEAIKFGQKYNVKRSEIDGNLLLGGLVSDPDEKLYHRVKSRDLYLELDAYIGAAFQSLSITEYWLAKGDLNKAYAELDSCILYAQNHNNEDKEYFYLMAIAYDLKKVQYQGLNEMDSAFHYSDLSNDFKIQAIQNQDQQRVNEIETLNAIEIEKNKRASIARERLILRWALALGTSIFLMLIYLYFVNHKNRQKICDQNKLIRNQNEQLQISLKEKTILLSEIHHRVKNNLQMIISLIVLQTQKTPNTSFKAQLSDISDKIHSIALIHEQLYKEGNFDKIELSTYIKHLASHFENIVRKKASLDIQLAAESINLNLETVIPIGIILSELISNSIKYGLGENSTLSIRINLKENKGTYHLKYKDNGNGIPSGKLNPSSESMGALLIFSMAQQLRAETKTYNEDGAVFEMIFIEKIISQL